tara:strand:+ start:335 stop:562 length:228 start_codon:yes stop_codon:yes gene_type:complete
VYAKPIIKENDMTTRNAEIDRLTKAIADNPNMARALNSKIEMYAAMSTDQYDHHMENLKAMRVCAAAQMARKVSA